MTMELARAQGLEMFFLPSAVEAEAFAEHMHKHTGRATGFFTEGVRQFQLHVTTVAPRPRPGNQITGRKSMMTKVLYELLSSDIYTDDSEYAERVKLIREIVKNATFADSTLEEEARELYAEGSSDDIEIDPEPPTSVAEGGTWVQAWVWVETND